LSLRKPDTRQYVAASTGTGKTWIACALGNQAAREGFSVLYTRLSRLLDDIATARLGSGAGALMRRIARVDLLLVDDWMMSELTATQRRDLMEIVDDRHDRGSIILATQIPLTSWHQAIGDATYAEAILDRIVHTAYRVELQGDSLRKPVRRVTAPSGSAIDQPTSHATETTGGFKFGRKHRSHALIEVVDGKDVQTIVRGGAGAD
jgi:hypothetical protein